MTSNSVEALRNSGLKRLIEMMFYYLFKNEYEHTLEHGSTVLKHRNPVAFSRRTVDMFVLALPHPTPPRPALFDDWPTLLMESNSQFT